ncbi:MAG: T9SS type A sorting domain-containing protein [Bacteroidetes bacterium]|nr:T9SS type A sorting domain-containing protein [Bacteroidota bacterium]
MTAGSIQSDQSICVGGTPDQLTTNSSPSYDGTPTYQWQSSTTSPGTSGFSDISGATAVSYSPDPLTTTTWYRRQVISTITADPVVCNAYSVAIKVTVYPIPDVTDPSGGTICNGGSWTMNVTASGGIGSYSYSWQSSSNGTDGWIEVSTTTNSYTASGLTTTTYYRVSVGTGGLGCSTKTSNNALVTVVSDPTISAEPTDATICTGGDQNLSVSASGGTPSLNYQWQYYTSSWITATGTSTNASYTTPTLTTTTQYRVYISAPTGNGCDPIYSRITYVNVVGDPGITVQPVDATICTGGTQNLTVTASGGTPSLTYEWQYLNGSNWETASGSYSGTTYSTPVLTTTSQYRVLVNASGHDCGQAISRTVIVNVVADPVIENLHHSGIICTGGTEDLSVDASGGTPSLNYQWQYYDGSTTWYNATGTSTNAAYTTPVLTTNVRYRVLVTATGHDCDPTSDFYDISVTHDPIVNANPADATICYQGTQTLTTDVTPDYDAGTLTYQWQSSLNGTSWSNVGTSSNTYTTANLTTNTYYRVVLTQTGSGCLSTTANALVTIVSDPTITSPPSGGTICTGGYWDLSVSASGGTPSLDYQWQVNSGGWQNASGTSTNTSYSTPTLTTTTQFRVIVSATGNGCDPNAMSTVTVTVVNDPTVTSSPSDATICSGGTQNLMVSASGGTPLLTYQWQYLNGTWQNAPGTSTSTSYTTTTLSTTTDYRVLISATGSDCNQASAYATVTVVSDPTITSLPSDGTICTGGTWDLTVSASGGTPSLSYQWQKSPNGTDTWSNVGTGTGYTTAGLTTNTWYRVLITAGGNGCDQATTSPATKVTVVSDPIITSDPSDGDPICSGGTQDLSVTATGGTPELHYMWQYNDGINWLDGLGVATNSTYTTPALTTTTQFRVLVTAGGNGCDQAKSNTATVTVVNDPTITSNPSNATICTNGIQLLTVTASAGTPSLNYEWQSGTSSSGPWEDVGFNTNSYTTPSLTVTTYYRVLVTATGHGCTQATSNVATVYVNYVTAGVVGNDQTICNSTVPAALISTTAPTYAGIVTYQWQSSTAGSSSGFGDIANATNETYQPSALTQDSWYRRFVFSTWHTVTCIDLSNASIVLVNNLTSGAIAGDQTICSGETPTLLTSISGGSGDGPITYQWQNSTVGGTTGFGDISGATALTYQPTSLTTDTWFRRVAISTTGAKACPLESNSVKVTAKARHAISGQMRYNNFDKSYMTNVTITLTDALGNTVGSSSITNSVGYYQFTGICDGNYKIVISNNNKVAGSVNSTDACQANTWITSAYSIQHVQFLAGDVYGNGNQDQPNYTITANDALHIQQYFVNGGSPPSNYYPWFDRGPWSYYKADSVILNNGDYRRDIKDINTILNGTNLTVDLYAQSTGDFNGSYLPDGAKSASANLHLTYGNTRKIGSDQEFELPIHVVAATKVTAISLIMNFPDDLVEIKGVYMNDNQGELDWAASGDELRIGWNALMPLNLAAFDNMVMLRLKTTSKFGDDKTIRFSLAADQLNELAGEDYKVIPDALLSIDEISASAIGIQEQPTSDKMTLENHPNPFTGQTLIVYSLPFDGKVNLEIHNLLGQSVKTLVNEPQTKGNHSFSFDANSLAPGVYTATLKLEDQGTKLFRSIKMIRNK